MRFFEDFVAGQVEDYGPIIVDRAEMLDFARAFDPQPMHLDENSAQAAGMGGLSASGWYTASRHMRMMAEHFLLNAAALGSPGVSRADWLAPVRAGDRLAGRMEVLEARASRSRPELGAVSFRFTLTNQRGTRAFLQECVILFRRRGRAGDTPPPMLEREALPDPAYPDRATAPGFWRLDAIEPGAVLYYGRQSFDARAMIAFARRYDPQPFHLDEAAGMASLFGGLAASGWHTGACWMRTVVDFWNARAAEAPLPKRGPGFGLQDLQWLRPVLAGDRLDYYGRIVEARPSASKPGWGIVTLRNYALNQHGTPVFAFTGAALWGLEP